MSSLVDDYVVLAGLPTKAAFVSAIERGSPAGETAPDREGLCREWDVASEHFADLQRREAGLADDVPLRPLPDSMTAQAQSALDELVQQPRYQVTQRSWRMVELDRLVVYQRSINVTYAHELGCQLPANPRDADVIHLAISPGVDGAMESEQLSPSRFAFNSESTIPRFVDAALLDAAMIQGFRPAGRATKMIALFIGTSVNHLSAIRFRGRLLLTDGSHRAFALRQLGVAYAPCLVEQVSSEEQLNRLGVKMLSEDRALFLNAARPALFKDYFDPRLRRQSRIARYRSSLDISFCVQSLKQPVGQ